MSGHEDDKAFVERSRELLRDQQVPAGIQRGLRQARANALDQLESGPNGLPMYRWAVPAGAAAVALLAVALLRQPGNDIVLPDLGEDEMSAAMEMELLDDMEFLAWMLEQDPDAG